MRADLALSLIPLFPLVGFLANGLLGRRLGVRAGGWLACLLPGLSFLCSVAIFMHLRAGGAPVHADLYEWLHIGNFSIDFNLYADALTSVMLLVVTGVGTLIHIYSLG